MKEKQIQELIKKYPTPAYVFDIGVLRRRIEYLHSLLPCGTSLCYAIKANTFILREISDIVERFEVCSPGELNICHKLSIPPDKLVISGVYKTPDIIANHISEEPEMTGLYTVESIRQFELLKDSAHKYGKKISLLLRLTSGNQFGLEEDDIKHLINSHKHDPLLDFRGIQYFSGTQKNSLKKLKREIDYADGFLQSLYDECGYRIKEFEFGPGLPVFYFQSDEFDEETFLNEFSSLLENMKFKAKITLEVGRSIAAECGCYITRVVDTKENCGQRYAIVDGGMNHIVYYGQSMAMKHPKYQMFPPRMSEETQTWNIFGSLCTINDVLVKQLPVADLKVGDFIIFQNTGAYCMTEGISLFLSRDLPHVVLIREDGTMQCVRENLSTHILNTPCYEQEDK